MRTNFGIVCRKCPQQRKLNTLRSYKINKTNTQQLFSVKSKFITQSAPRRLRDSFLAQKRNQDKVCRPVKASEHSWVKS